MSWLSKLLGLSSAHPTEPQEPTLGAKASPKAKGRKSSARIHLSDGILSIDEFGFVGMAESSANKRWVVGYRDGGHGIKLGPDVPSVVLVDRQADEVVHGVATFKRPSHAAVSDVGVYVIDDGTQESKLASDIVVVDTGRTVLFRRHYDALVYALAISPCGRYVALQTCNAPSGDSNHLEVLDAKAKAVLFSVTPSTAWSQKYKFDIDGGELKRLLVEVKGLGRFAYLPDGSFPDRERLRDAAMASGGISERVRAAQNLFAEFKDADTLSRVLAVAVQAASSAGEYEQSWKTAAQRLQGEVLEALGRDEDAIALYEGMLAGNAKVGVKAKLNALKKKR